MDPIKHTIKFLTHNGSFAETRVFPGIQAREAKNLLLACGLTPHEARAVINRVGVPAWGTWVVPGAQSLPRLCQGGEP